MADCRHDPVMFFRGHDGNSAPDRSQQFEKISGIRPGKRLLACTDHDGFAGKKFVMACMVTLLFSPCYGMHSDKVQLKFTSPSGYICFRARNITDKGVRRDKIPDFFKQLYVRFNRSGKNDKVSVVKLFFVGFKTVEAEFLYMFDILFIERRVVTGKQYALLFCKG